MLFLIRSTTERTLRDKRRASLKLLLQRLGIRFSICKRTTLPSSNGDTTHTVALIRCSSSLSSGLMLTLRSGGRSNLHRLIASVRDSSDLARGRLLAPGGARRRWALQLLAMRYFMLMNVQFRLPVLHIVFAVVQDLPGLCAVVVRSLPFTWDHRTVVEKLQETAAMAG